LILICRIWVNNKVSHGVCQGKGEAAVKIEGGTVTRRIGNFLLMVVIRELFVYT
jgi:hypothetical protein